MGEGWMRVLGGLSPGATIATGGAFALKSDVLREKMGAGCAH
jgi:cobalt-zinc-cadmium efflux system membrane fusion protein